MKIPSINAAPHGHGACTLPARLTHCSALCGGLETSVACQEAFLGFNVIRFSDEMQ